MTHDGTPIVEVNQASWAWSFRQPLIIQLEASIKRPERQMERQK